MTHTERTYYLVTCLYRLAWAALGPMYALFLLNRGLDLLQVNLVLALYLIVTCVFEVPTGAVADVFGRKVSFLLSCAVRAVAFGLYFFADEFHEFLVAEFIDAVGTTLATGALDAWAVDGIRAEGDRRPADRLFARGQMLGQTMAIAGGVSCGYLAEVDLSYPWLVGMAGFLLCGVVGAFSMREVRPPVASFAALRAGAAGSVAAMVRDGVATVRDAPVLRWLCGLTLLTSFAIVPAYQTWQPRLQGLAGEGPWLLGWVWAMLNLASIAGSALIPGLVRRFGRAHALLFATAWRALMLGLAAAATSFPLALAGWLLQEVAGGVNDPVKTAWMNEYASSAQRATVLSIRSMSFTLGGAAGLVCLGWVAREFGIATAWGISAAIYALVAPAFLILARVARDAPALPAAAVAPAHES